MPRRKLSPEERLIRFLPPPERERARALAECTADGDGDCRIRRLFQIACGLYTQTNLTLKDVLDRLRALAPLTRHCPEARGLYSEKKAEKRKLDSVLKTCTKIVTLVNQRESPYCEICQTKIYSGAVSLAQSPASTDSDGAPAPGPPASPASPQPGPSSAPV